jgi:hypothetical protein
MLRALSSPVPERHIGTDAPRANLLSRLDLQAQQVACYGSTLQASTRAHLDTGKGNQGDDDNKGLSRESNTGGQYFRNRGGAGESRPSAAGSYAWHGLAARYMPLGGIFFPSLLIRIGVYDFS